MNRTAAGPRPQHVAAPEDLEPSKALCLGWPLRPGTGRAPSPSGSRGQAAIGVRGGLSLGERVRVRGIRVALLLCSLVPAWAAERAELVIRHAEVLTVRTNRPKAEAFAVAGGRFLAVGADDAMQPLVGPSTRILDLAGKTVVPGFIDAHLHPQTIFPEESPWAAVELGPGKVRSIDELVAALKRKAEKTPAGLLVTGSRYQETKLGRHPTRHDLDRSSTNHPILISHSSGHQSVCNSFALQLAKVTRDTPDPAGGRFVRDDRGELTGLLQERAAGMVRAACPRNPNPSEAETLAAYRAGFRQYVSRGLTSVHVAGVSPATARLLSEARAVGPPLRLYIMLNDASRDEVSRRRRDGQLGDDGVRFGAVKLFHGNSVSGQTCWLSKPYAHRPDYFGVAPARSQEQLNKVILAIHEAGLQACAHSNGDREIDMVLTAFENALRQKPRPDHRHRIEHCSVVTEGILQRIKTLGLVIVSHSYLDEHGDKMEVYGVGRWDWMHPARSLIDLGIPMAGHSDSPVSAADPLRRIQDMVLRVSAEGKVYGPKQRISVEEALRTWTLGGAFASFEEGLKGSIEVGKLADFVVLAKNPTRVQPEQIKDIAVERTFIGGQAVYERP